MEAIDLRSDTVTRPTPDMRRAMAECEVGDDVLGEDPTAAILEERAAELTGKEAALFVPSGTMGNLMALMLHASPGDEVLLCENSHMNMAESGSAGRLAGVVKWMLRVDRFGRPDPAEIERSIHGHNIHVPTTRLLCLENTHNFAGGTVLAQEDMRACVAPARRAGLRVHLDGARIFNASIKMGCKAADLAAEADSVMFCVSKGLCSPVGSLLCGTREFVVEARRVRKMLGGGMRQVGVLAACGLVSVSDAMISRLAEDHENCRVLAEGMAGIRGVRIDLETVQTNILFFELEGARMDAATFRERLWDEGVLSLAVGHRTRMVTHRDVSRAGVDRVLAVANRLLG